MGQRPIQRTTPMGRKYEKAPKKGPINVLLDRQSQLLPNNRFTEIGSGNLHQLPLPKRNTAILMMQNQINPQESVIRLSSF